MSETRYVVWRGAMGRGWIPVSRPLSREEAQESERAFAAASRYKDSIYYFNVYPEGKNPNDA